MNAPNHSAGSTSRPVSSASSRRTQSSGCSSSSEEAARQVPHARRTAPRPPGEQDAPGVVDAERACGRRRVRVGDVAAGRALGAAAGRLDVRAAARAVPPLVEESHSRQYVRRCRSASTSSAASACSQSCPASSCASSPIACGESASDAGATVVQRRGRGRTLLRRPLRDALGHPGVARRTARSCGPATTSARSRWR